MPDFLQVPYLLVIFLVGIWDEGVYSRLRHGGVHYKSIYPTNPVIHARDHHIMHHPQPRSQPRV